MAKYKRKSNNDFPDEVVKLAFIIADEKCENCGQELRKENRGNEDSYGWEAHHINPDDPGTLENCRILCQDCHKDTMSYGRKKLKRQRKL